MRDANPLPRRGGIDPVADRDRPQRRSADRAALTRFSPRLAWIAALVAAAVAPPASAAFSFRLLTLGKSVELANTGDPATSGGVFRVGRDAALQPLLAPECPAVSRVDVSTYLQSTNRNAVLATRTLDCSRWRFERKAWRYDDAAGPIRSIVYGAKGLSIGVGGPGYTPIDGPVAFVQVQLVIDDVALRARYHGFERNDAELVRSHRTSRPGALGEVLDLALQVNPFFNVFDLIPVLHISGSLTLFGDVYAKGGDLARASFWYTLADALTPASWPFKTALTARLADVAGRIALYQDADPSNDPPILGAGAESGVACHTRP